MLNQGDKSNQPATARYVCLMVSFSTDKAGTGRIQEMRPSVS